MHLFEGWSRLLNNDGLSYFAFRLWFLREWRRACAFDIIWTIWWASWFLGDCGLFLISLDLTLQVSLEFLDPFLYLINTAFTWVLLLRLGINFCLYFDLLSWSNTLLLISPSCIFIFFTQRRLFRLGWAPIIILFLWYESSISYGCFAMLVFIFDGWFTAWIDHWLLSSW